MDSTPQTPFVTPFGLILESKPTHARIAVIPPEVDEATRRQVQARVLWDRSWLPELADTIGAATVVVLATVVGHLIEHGTAVQLVGVAAATYMGTRSMSKNPPRWLPSRVLAPRLTQQAEEARRRTRTVVVQTTGPRGRRFVDLLWRLSTDPLPDTAEDMFRFTLGHLAEHDDEDLSMSDVDHLVDGLDYRARAAARLR